MAPRHLGARETASASNVDLQQPRSSWVAVNHASNRRRGKPRALSFNSGGCTKAAHSGNVAAAPSRRSHCVKSASCFVLRGELAGQLSAMRKKKKRTRTKYEDADAALFGRELIAPTLIRKRGRLVAASSVMYGRGAVLRTDLRLQVRRTKDREGKTTMGTR
ncbi:unnamed protein product [Lasius platythorax]|uniref:Uncharacterized protein n=1 Tax=Lasius platythorax TaxID=488582 RepID=A0AAV2NCE5_9HYME